MKYRNNEGKILRAVAFWQVRTKGRGEKIALTVTLLFWPLLRPLGL